MVSTLLKKKKVEVSGIIQEGGTVILERRGKK